MPPRKKAKSDNAEAKTPGPEEPVTTEKPVRRKRNTRDNLSRMPIGVLLKIFVYLEPRDLLYLSRMSKGLRKLLLNRQTSGAIWTAAVENVGDLPRCPPDFSLPAWINLLFSPHCHNCLKTNIQSNRIFWEFGVRYCSQCEREMTVPFFWIYKDVPAPPEDEPTLGIRPDYINGWEGDSVVHLPEIKEFKEQWSKTPKSKRAAMIQERIARVKANYERGQEGRKWLQRVQCRRNKEYETGRRQREFSIFWRLRELGWGKVLDRLSDEEMHWIKKDPRVAQSKPLTERMWLNMRDDLVTYLEECRDARRQRGA